MCSCKLAYSLFLKTYRKDGWNIKHLSQMVELKSENTKKKYKTHAKELNAYLTSTKHLESIKDRLPARCLKKNRNMPDDLYLVDSAAVKTITSAIIPDIKKNKGIVVESNPGFGFISNKLLEAGISKIHLYEPTVAFRDYLFDLNKLYPNKLKIYNKDFFLIWKLAYQDKYDNGDRVKNMIKDIDIKDWNDDIAMNIIGILPNSNFIRHLILSLISQSGIMAHGRSNLYVCVPPYLYLLWSAKPTDGFYLYRALSVLMQIFCDLKFLEKIPRKCFLPWDSHLKEKQSQKKKYPQFYVDTDYLYLIKISFKKPLPVPVDQLQQLWYFVTHMMVSRKNRVIPILEKWIPGSGWNLITTDVNKYEDLYPYINIYTRIGDMTPQQILFLFKTFASWPEYAECSFIASIESALLKMEHPSEDTIESSVKADEHHEEDDIKENIEIKDSDHENR